MTPDYWQQATQELAAADEHMAELVARYAGLGLVSRVVPDAELESTALALATEFAESATYALALAKKMFQSMYVPTLEQLCEMETLASGIVRLTQDHKEGVAAFQERRAPRFPWKGRR